MLTYPCRAEKELWFDFGPARAGAITQAEFRKHFGHLQFDRVLQYVAFPRVQLKQQGDAPVVDERCQGRQDMAFFFDWLWGKGVRRIIKVIVDDLGHPPHSDEAIEKALKPFDVEILDWRRLDLDPVTLETIGKGLREVHLQWSGRNTVLRSWSEPGGLANTPTLEMIRIVQTEVLPCPRCLSVLKRVFRLMLTVMTETGPKLTRADSQKSCRLSRPTIQIMA